MTSFILYKILILETLHFSAVQNDFPFATRQFSELRTFFFQVLFGHSKRRFGLEASNASVRELYQKSDRPSAWRRRDFCLDGCNLLPRICAMKDPEVIPSPNLGCSAHTHTHIYIFIHIHLYIHLYI